MYVTDSDKSILLVFHSSAMLSTCKDKGSWRSINIKMCSVRPVSIPLKEDEHLRDMKTLVADYTQHNAGDVFSIKTADLNITANTAFTKKLAVAWGLVLLLPGSGGGL
jgi:hypothetical protein